MAAATTLAGLFPVSAQEASQINVNGAVRSDWNGGTLTYLHAFSGDLREDSVLLRFGVGTGDGWEDDASRMRVHVLLGYQAFVGDWRLRGLAGPSYTSQDGDDQTGLLVIGQASNNRRNPVYIGTSASYDTAQDRWSARVEVGEHLGKLIIGPEFGISGDSDTHRTSFGAFLTGAKLGDVSLTLRTGYSRRSDTDEGSHYFGLSATLQF